MSLLTHGRNGPARPATLAALVAVLSVLGCGQKTPSGATGAKTAATDTVAQCQPVPADSSSLEAAPDVAISTSTLSESSAPESKPAQRPTGAAALAKAAAAGKYLLIVFYRNGDDETRAMKKTISSAAARLKASSITVDVADAAEKDIVARYGVDRAPMPLALVVAPNGAVTGGFPVSVTEEQLSGAFVGPATASCLKALQDGKFVFLCAQNNSTSSNEDALKGVRAFREDARYAKATEIVSVDPADPAEAKFLGQVKIDPRTNVAMTAFLAPPGAVVATYSGATDKNTIVAALTRATPGSGGG